MFQTQAFNILPLREEMISLKYELKVLMFTTVKSFRFCEWYHVYKIPLPKVEGDTRPLLKRMTAKLNSKFSISRDQLLNQG